MKPPYLPIVRSRDAHSISRDFIDQDALKVLYRLKTTGFKAYLVGGSVRDLLLHRQPKDFDIGTDARPEQIRAVFRNSRLVGRRFRLAHILFRGGKIIEVATFRAEPNHPAREDDDLLVTSDNTYGTPEQDARRRDFTVNGLFYNISDFTVIDHVGGLADLEAGLIRSIGLPEIRFREDPVRMLRAVEFAARLSFSLTPADYGAFAACRRELTKSAAPRVAEELAAMLRGGRALPTFLLLREMGLLDVVLPDFAAELRRQDPEHPGGAGHFFWALLEVLDAERQRGRTFDEAVLMALLALPLWRAELARQRGGGPIEPALAAVAAERAVAPMALRLAFPNFLAHRVKSLLTWQERLHAEPHWKAATRRFLVHPDFAPTLDLAELAEMARGKGPRLTRQWRALHAKVLAAGTGFPAGGGPPARPRRRRRHQKIH